MSVTLDRPLKLEILHRLSDMIREITPANGYVRDFSGDEDTRDNRVFRGRTVYGSSDPLPMVSILEAPIPLDQLAPPEDSTFGSGPWELVIQGFEEDDKINPTDPAYVSMADVRKRLAEERAKMDWDKPEDGPFGLGRAITGFTIGPGVVRPPDGDVSAKAYFWLTIVLEVVEDVARPYEVSN